ncbi:DUF3703 domain-containing protein [Owenweeksia hongkongensis]|uniref:DUF3703 domain-containing protein n=1 Tax=Owenweeksia hongkongensis TaxID=253245 RepID=UPI003A9062F5
MPVRFKIQSPKALKPYLQKELLEYRQHLDNANYTAAWQHLERAHVLGQAFAWPHTYVHFKMLQFGIHIKNTKEVIGQIPRLLVGGVKSFVGEIPLGNTGGANVPPLKPLPIEPEIEAIFKKCNIQH